MSKDHGEDTEGLSEAIAIGSAWFRKHQRNYSIRPPSSASNVSAEATNDRTESIKGVRRVAMGELVYNLARYEVESVSLY
jgi:hypothetical protein